MALCRLSGTLTLIDESPAVGTIVTAQMANFPTANRNTNRVFEARTNQQGVFMLDLQQGASMRIIIRDLGIDIVATIPATPTTTLATLMV